MGTRLSCHIPLQHPPGQRTRVWIPIGPVVVVFRNELASRESYVCSEFRGWRRENSNVPTKNFGSRLQSDPLLTSRRMTTVVFLDATYRPFVVF